MKTVNVVAAIICDDYYHKTKVFATQRGYGEFKDGWEFPGGKIEEGETPQQALVREIKEELDTDIEVHDLIDWTCKGCGMLLVNPDVPVDDDDTYWICDQCGALLNEQDSFTEEKGSGPALNVDISIRSMRVRYMPQRPSIRHL